MSNNTLKNCEFIQNFPKNYKTNQKNINGNKISINTDVNKHK